MPQLEVAAERMSARKGSTRLTLGTALLGGAVGMAAALITTGDQLGNVVPITMTIFISIGLNCTIAGAIDYAKSP